MNGWVTIRQAASASFVERKSEFIGNCCPVETEEEALAFVNSIRKQYADAKHNVYAYILRENQTTRFSDDGEPHGTAGLPVLDVLRKEGVSNVAVVVTRYFGGILLGTGGLVRAYTQAAKMALDAAGKQEVEKLMQFLLQCNYSDHPKLDYILSNYSIKPVETIFDANVSLKLICRETDFPKIRDALVEQSNGRAAISDTKEIFGTI